MTYNTMLYYNWKCPDPYEFTKKTKILLIVLALIAIATMGIGLIWSILFTPQDFRQGGAVRIMFVHVPSAFMSSIVYVAMASSSFISLVWKKPIADFVAKSCAPVGLLFAALTIITGSLWGKPIWGVAWVWDARLTSQLILLFIYIGYSALWLSLEDFPKKAKFAAIYCLAGLMMIPIIKFSVYWWRTLHQKSSIFSSGQNGMHDMFLNPLILMIIAFISTGAVLVIMGIRKELFLHKLRSLNFLQ